MKIQSNIPIPDVQQWKPGFFLVAVNQVDNGVQDQENAGKRYTADFTIVDALDAKSAVYAFTRMIKDPVFDQKVIDTIEVNAKPAIETKVIYKEDIPATTFKPLPVIGDLKRGELYNYNDSVVMVTVDHSLLATDKPAEMVSVFSVCEITKPEAVKEWIEKTEYKEGDQVLFKEQTYTCLKDHTSSPELTPEDKELWKLI